LLDRFEHPSLVCEKIVVPKSQNYESGSFEGLGSFRIHSISVLTTVQFDNQRSLETYEVQNEIGERMLPAKFAVFNLPAAQTLPKQVLGIRRSIAQSALQLRSEDLLVRLSSHDGWHQHHPHPTLPLKGRALERFVVFGVEIIESPFTIPTQPSP